MKTLDSKKIKRNKKTTDILREYIRFIQEDVGGIDSVNILSQYAHRDQKRRTGEPYFLHPQEVSNIVKKYYPGNKVAYYSALLHDSMEDGLDLGNFEDEDELIAFILDAISDDKVSSRVIEVVSLLTKRKNAPYDSYIRGIMNDPDAVIVKLADILHNLSDNPSPRQIVKYGKAVRDISDSSQGPPTFVNRSHWNALLKLTQTEK